MKTITHLAREFGLSRSTLLYYHRLNLLSPSGRSTSNYRLYTEADRDRLRRICSLRETGVSLTEIKQILDTPDTTPKQILASRLDSINSEISALRKQQQLILKILGAPELTDQTRVMTKDTWVALMEAAGLDQEGRRKWHREFEASAPEAHQDFLESLDLSEREIRLIRKHSR